MRYCRPTGKAGECIECGRERGQRADEIAKKRAYSHSEKGRQTRQKYYARDDVRKRRNRYQLEWSKRHLADDTDSGKRLRKRKREYGRTEKNLAYKRAVHQKRMRDDPDYVTRRRLRRRLHAALEAHAHGKVMTADEYGIDWQAVVEFLGPCPGPRADYQIDHIRPLASFDLTDPDRVKEAFAPENHRWLTVDENKAKSDNIEIGDVLWPRHSYV